MYRPINAALVSWIFDGELFDKSLEFFIACDESAKEDKLWRSKYSIRHSMLPSFISEDLAENKVHCCCLIKRIGGTACHQISEEYSLVGLNILWK